MLKAREKKFWLERRSKHLLTGLARCGDCGAPLAAAGKDYLSCSAARRLGTCKNRKGIRRAVLEELILDALKHNLMHPDFVAEFIREFHAEINRQRRDAVLGKAPQHVDVSALRHTEIVYRSADEDSQGIDRCRSPPALLDLKVEAVEEDDA